MGIPSIFKLMDTNDKILTRLKLAASLRLILNKNKAKATSNEIKGIEDVTLIDSIRKLEASSRLSYTIIQGVFSAQRDLQFSSLVSIIEDGFSISMIEFAKIYDSITDEEIKLIKKEISSTKRKKANAPKKK